MLPRFAKHLPPARIFLPCRFYTAPTSTKLSYPTHVKRALLMEKALNKMRDATAEDPNKLETLKRIKRELVLVQLKTHVEKGGLTQEEATLVGDMLILEDNERQQILGDISFPFSTSKLDTLAAALTERNADPEFKAHVMMLKMKRDELKQRLGTQIQNLKNTPVQDLEHLSQMEKQYHQQLQDIEQQIGKLSNPALEALQAYTNDKLETIKNRFYEFLETKFQEPQTTTEVFAENEPKDQYWKNLLNNPSKENVFNDEFKNFIIYLMKDCTKEKRQAILNWLKTEKKRMDIVKRCQTAFIRQKVYTSSTHQLIHEEIAAEKYYKQVDDEVKDTYPFKHSDFSGKTAIASHLQNLYDEKQRPSAYEVTRDQENSAKLVKDFLPKNANETTSYGKRFKSQDRDLRGDDELFRTDEYYQDLADPYGLNDYSDPHGLNIEQSENLKKFILNYNEDPVYGNKDLMTYLKTQAPIAKPGSAIDFEETSRWLEVINKTIAYLDPFAKIDPDEEEEDEDASSELDFMYTSIAERPDTFFGTYPFEEMQLRLARNTVAKKGGRVESYSAIMLLGTKGYVGIGFGQGASPLIAEEDARKTAIRYLRSLPLNKDGRIHQEVLLGKYNTSRVMITAHSGEDVRGHPILKKISEFFCLRGITIKTFGSRNIMSIIPAYFNALEKYATLEQESTTRGIPMNDLVQNRKQSIHSRVSATRVPYQ